MMLRHGLRPLLRFAAFAVCVSTVLYFGLGLTQKHEESTPFSAIQHGDILLFDGRSARSDIVRVLRLNRSRFSHAGIACIESQDVYVIHADPTLGCVKERLFDLLETHRVHAVVAFRCVADPALAAISVLGAAQYVEQNIPFDHDFDNYDSSSLYCTELICRAYSDTGIELCTFSNSYIFPDHLAYSPMLKRVSPTLGPNNGAAPYAATHVMLLD